MNQPSLFYTPSRSYVLGSSLLVFIFMQFVLPVLLLYLNIEINPVYFPLSILCAIGWLYWLSFKSRKETKHMKNFLINLLIFTGILGFSLWISARFFDCSYDGQFYQQDGIIALSEGWNPIRSKQEHHHLLINYPKSLWYVWSCAYTFLNKIEPVKYTQFIFLFSSFFLTLAAFEAINKHTRVTQILISLIIALNPVLLYQSLSFYVDGMLAGNITILLSLMVLYYKGFKKNGTLIFIILLLIFLVNIKFTGVGFAFILMGGFVGLHLLEKQWKEFYKLTVSSFMALIFAMGIIGYQPYITNTRDFGHPFYPLNEKDLMSNQGPKQFKENNRFINLISSNYFRSEGWISPKKSARLKTPFDVSDQRAFISHAPRVGGFGSLFSAILSITLVLLIFLIIKNRFKDWQIYYLLAIVLFSVLIMPACWWARYVPQFFLFPLIIISWALTRSNRNILFKILSYFCLFVALMNVAIILNVHYSYNLRTTKKIITQLEKIDSRPINIALGCFESMELRFKERGIPYQIKDGLERNQSIELNGGKRFSRFQFNDSLFFVGTKNIRSTAQEHSDSVNANSYELRDNSLFNLDTISDVHFGEKIWIKTLAESDTTLKYVVKSNGRQVYVEKTKKGEHSGQLEFCFTAGRDYENLEVFLQYTGSKEAYIYNVKLEYYKFNSIN